MRVPTEQEERVSGDSGAVLFRGIVGYDAPFIEIAGFSPLVKNLQSRRRDPACIQSIKVAMERAAHSPQPACSSIGTAGSLTAWNHPLTSTAQVHLESLLTLSLRICLRNDSTRPLSSRIMCTPAVRRASATTPSSFSGRDE